MFNSILKSVLPNTTRSARKISYKYAPTAELTPAELEIFTTRGYQQIAANRSFPSVAGLTFEFNPALAGTLDGSSAVNKKAAAFFKLAPTLRQAPPVPTGISANGNRLSASSSKQERHAWGMQIKSRVARSAA